MRILITGHRGQLGQALLREFLHDQVLGIDLPEHDITTATDITQTICDYGPDVVVHPAALTDVDVCARQPEMALRVNGLGTHNVALACLQCGAGISDSAATVVMTMKFDV